MDDLPTFTTVPEGGLSISSNNNDNNNTNGSFFMTEIPALTEEHNDYNNTISVSSDSFHNQSSSLPLNNHFQQSALQSPKDTSSILNSSDITDNLTFGSYSIDTQHLQSSLGVQQNVSFSSTSSQEQICTSFSDHNGFGTIPFRQNSKVSETDEGNILTSSQTNESLISNSFILGINSALRSSPIPYATSYQIYSNKADLPDHIENTYGATSYGQQQSAQIQLHQQQQQPAPFPLEIFDLDSQKINMANISTYSLDGLNSIQQQSDELTIAPYLQQHQTKAVDNITSIINPLPFHDNNSNQLANSSSSSANVYLLSDSSTFIATDNQQMLVPFTQGSTLQLFPSTPTEAGVPNTAVKSPVKNFLCTPCDKLYGTAGHLKRHYDTIVHKNKVKSSGQPDPATLLNTQHHRAAGKTGGTRKAIKPKNQQTNQQLSTEETDSLQACYNNGRYQPYPPQQPLQEIFLLNDHPNDLISAPTRQQQVLMPSNLLDNNYNNNTLPNNTVSITKTESMKVRHNMVGRYQRRQKSSTNIKTFIPKLEVLAENKELQAVKMGEYYQTTTPQYQLERLQPDRVGSPNISSNITTPETPPQPTPLATTITMPATHIENILNPPHNIAQVEAINNTTLLNNATNNTTTTPTNSLPSFQELMTTQKAKYTIMGNAHVNNMYSPPSDKLSSSSNQMLEDQPLIWYIEQTPNLPPTPLSLRSSISLSSTDLNNENLTFSQDNASENFFSSTNLNNQSEAKSSVAKNSSRQRKRKSSNGSSTLPIPIYGQFQNGILKCTKCLSEFSSVSYLTQHHDSKHNPALNVICQKCGKKFKSEADRDKHFSRHFKLNHKFHCRACPNSYAYRHDLKRHEDKHHGDMKKNTCKACQKSFQRHDHLRTHLETHLPKSERKKSKRKKSSNATEVSSSFVLEAPLENEESISISANAIPLPVMQQFGQITITEGLLE